MRTRQRPRPRRTTTLWSATAWIVLVISIAGSLAGAAAWRAYQRSQAQHQFEHEAADIGSTVSTALARADDLTATNRAFVMLHQPVSKSQWRAWVSTLDVARRYPNTLAFGFIERVPRAQLASWWSAYRAENPTAHLPARPVIIPAGNRPYYCLLRLIDGDFLKQWPAGLDACGFTGPNPLKQAIATGQFQVENTPIGVQPSMLILAPVYRGLGIPTSSSARTQQAAGVVGSIVDANGILRAAVGHRHGLQVDVIRQDTPTAPPSVTGANRVGVPLLQNIRASSALLSSVGNAGRHPVYRSTITLNADGRWLVRVSGSPSNGLFSPTAQGVGIFIVGALLSMLMFFLLRVLMRARARALELVRLRTEELERANDALSYQATHDALTGLLNRGGFYELAPAQLRNATDHEVALLLVDLDGFKEVNDTHGHHVGDGVLVEVGRRLQGVVRDADLVGRVGGDEFAVLLSTSADTDRAEQVAARIVLELAEPYLVEERVVRMSASVGVGVAASGIDIDTLIATADTLMYDAKRSGKGLYRARMTRPPSPPRPRESEPSERPVVE